VAVLRIAATGLKSIPFGDSDGLEVGDVVLAIGNPFGVGQTVTSGIISALGRSGLTAANYEDFIQTDAPINPGNAVQSVTPDIAAAGGLAQAKGAIIGTVEKGSPAERAGLKAGDVIIDIDGKAVLSASDLRNRIGLRESGSKVTVTYLRQGQQHTVALVTAATE
jgi:S1-C subfamily serine protease